MSDKTLQGMKAAKKGKRRGEIPQAGGISV